MANVHGLFSGQNDDDSSDDENNRFVGGISDRGGGRYDWFCALMDTTIGMQL
jgi:hypothetical protein